MEDAIAKLAEVLAAIAHEAKDLVKTISEFIVSGLLASFGAMAKYFSDNMTKKQAFSFAIFFTNVFLAFFVGNVVESFLPASIESKGGILMMAGFCTYPILNLIEVKGKDIVAVILKVKP